MDTIRDIAWEYQEKIEDITQGEFSYSAPVDYRKLIETEEASERAFLNQLWDER